MYPIEIRVFKFYSRRKDGGGIERKKGAPI
jgi:hypothetical protein